MDKASKSPAKNFPTEILRRDFPGGSVVQNSPANAGDMGSIPGPGRFHTLRDNEAHVPQLLSPPPRADAPHQGKPQQ